MWLVVPDGDVHQDVRLHDPFEVGAVFGEGDSPTNVSAAKDALRRFVRLALVLTGHKKVLEAVDKVAAIQRQLERLDPQRQTPQAVDVDRSRRYLGENGQAFLSPRRARCAEAETLEIRLPAAVDRRGRMDQCFVVEELVKVQIGKEGRTSNANTRRPGNQGNRI